MQTRNGSFYSKAKFLLVGLCSLRRMARSVAVLAILGGVSFPALADVDVLVSSLEDTPDPATRGGDITYTIKVDNNGTDTATGVAVTIPLPANTVHQSSSMSNNGVCTLNGGGTSVTCIPENGILPSRSQQQIDVVIRTTGNTSNTIQLTANIEAGNESAESSRDNNSLPQTTTIRNGADLELTSVSVPTNSIPNGGQVTWTISGQNNGPDAAVNSRVVVELPASLTFVSGAGTNFNCSATGQIVTCDYAGALNKDDVFNNLQLVTNVNGFASGNVLITPRISSSTSDPFPNNNQRDSSPTLEITPGADLSIVHTTTSPQQVISGQSVELNLRVSNDGPDQATSGATVRYPLPAGFTNINAIPADPAWLCSVVDQEVVCTYSGSLAPGAGTDIRVTATAPTVTSRESYEPRATVAHNDASVTDPIPSNNNSPINILVAPEGPGLGVNKTRSPSIVAAGQEITNTIVVENTGFGTAPAGSIQVTDVISDISRETFVRYHGDNDWSCSTDPVGSGTELNLAATTATCVYGKEVLPGRSTPPLTIITKAANISPGFRTTNTANVACQTGTCWTAIPSSAAEIQVTELTKSIDLAITKEVSTAAQGTAAPGTRLRLGTNETTMEYKIVVTNLPTAQNVDATGIVMIDEAIPGWLGEIPASGNRPAIPGTPAINVGVTPSLGSTAEFNCVMTNSRLRCEQTAGVLAPNETVTFTVPVSRHLREGDFENEVNVFSETQGDTNPTNNRDTVLVGIDALTDVEMVSKVVTPTATEAGTVANYVLTFRNNGASSAQTVTVRDQFVVQASDPGFTVLAINPVGWSSGSAPTCTGLAIGQSYGPGASPEITCVGGTLARGEQRTIEIQVRPNWKSGQQDGQVWTIANTASISTSTTELSFGNNSKPAVLNVNAARVDLLINNSDNVDPLGYDRTNNGDNPQNDVIYAVKLDNNGPSLATGVGFTYEITPPDGQTARFLGDSALAGPPGASGSICSNVGNTVTGPSTLRITCSYTGQSAQLDNGDSHTRYLSVRILSEPPSTGENYRTSARVFSNETDYNSLNDVAPQTTTIRSDIPVNNLSLSGKVYVDINNNGVAEGNEPGIGGVTITLSGRTLAPDGVTEVDVCSVIPSCTIQTAPDGSYIFPGLPRSTAAGYTITETQPAGYTNGQNQVGSLGSINGNPPGHTLPPGPDTFTVVLENQSGTGYNFGEVGIASNDLAKISGHVWLDGDHDRVFNSAGPSALDVGQDGWTVQLLKDGNLVAETTTGSTGAYTFENLLPGSGYQVLFVQPGNAVYGQAKQARPNEQGLSFTNGVVDPNSNPAGASNADAGLSGITLRAGDDITQHSLPLDPGSVIYDAVTRQPIRDAEVTVQGPPGFRPELHLVGGSATQRTGQDGIYRLLLNSGAPAGTYTLTVRASGYLPQVSSTIPACNAALRVSGMNDPELVQQNTSAPGVGVDAHDPATCAVTTDGSFATGSAGLAAAATRYYLTLNFDGTSTNLLNNHIPLDPANSGIIRVTKVTPLVNVVRGDLVPYTITAQSSIAVANADVTDRLPPGFKYRSGSASSNGVRVEPEINGRDITWKNQTFSEGETKTYKLILVVGTGVGEGQYTNQAWAQNNGGILSNIGSATVKVTPDPTFDCSDIIGKVFDDKNANGYQDQGEPGIPNVRVVTARGLLVTTDAEGRFHVTCADIPNMDRGANFVMKLDERTLPSGYRVTTENPRDVRVTRGKMVKLNFGATVHRVVRLDVSDEAFEQESTELKPQWQQAFADMVKQLDGRPSVLRIAYDPGGGGEKLAKKRLDSVAKAARKLWKDTHNNNKDEAAFPLIIETAVEDKP